MFSDILKKKFFSKLIFCDLKVILELVITLSFITDKLYLLGRFPTVLSVDLGHLPAGLRPSAVQHHVSANLVRFVSSGARRAQNATHLSPHLICTQNEQKHVKKGA